MSYLETVREQVSVAKEEELERFKSFVDDFCIGQFKDTSPHPSAVTSKDEVVSQGINADNLCKWLEEQGLTVDSGKGFLGSIVISYEEGK